MSFVKHRCLYPRKLPLNSLFIRLIFHSFTQPLHCAPYSRSSLTQYLSVPPFTLSFLSLFTLVHPASVPCAPRLSFLSCTHSVISTATPSLFLRALSSHHTHPFFACCTLNTRVQHSPVRAFCHCAVLSLLALNIPTNILLRRVFFFGLSFSLLPRAFSL